MGFLGKFFSGGEQRGNGKGFKDWGADERTAFREQTVKEMAGQEGGAQVVKEVPADADHQVDTEDGNSIYRLAPTEEYPRGRLVLLAPKLVQEPEPEQKDEQE